MVSRIVSRDGFWPEAVQGLSQWLYYDRSSAPRRIGGEIRSYLDELMPSDPVELAALYALGWPADFHDPDANYDPDSRSDADFEYAARKVVEMADLIVADPAAIERALDKFVSSEAKTVFPFARQLAELVPNVTDLFRAALSKSNLRHEAANLSFFTGLIAGADSRDPSSARECIRLALHSEKLKNYAISMIGAGNLQPDDIRLVVSLLQSHDVEPRQCAFLSYGRRLERLSPDHIAPLLGELARHGAEGLWTILEIAAMIFSMARNRPSRSSGFCGTRLLRRSCSTSSNTARGTVTTSSRRSYI